MTTNIIKVLEHMGAAKSRPSVKFLDVIYGPMARQLRAELATLMTGQPVAKHAKKAQYGRLRKALLEALDIEGTCSADEDATFETRVNTMLFGPPDMKEP